MTPPPLQIYILKKSQKEKFNMVRAFKIGANLSKEGLGPPPRCRVIKVLNYMVKNEHFTPGFAFFNMVALWVMGNLNKSLNIKYNHQFNIFSYLLQQEVCKEVVTEPIIPKQR